MTGLENRDAMAATTPSVVVKDWSKEGRQRKFRREVDVTGEAMPGSELLEGQVGYSIYASPPPTGSMTASGDSMGAFRVDSSSVVRDVDASGTATIRIVESVAAPFGTDTPVGLSVGGPAQRHQPRRCDR